MPQQQRDRAFFSYHDTNYGLSPCIFAADTRDTTISAGQGVGVGGRGRAKGETERERERDRESTPSVQPFASNAFGICCGMYRVSIRLQSNFNSSEIRAPDKHKGKSFSY